ncbi:hypothetical protein APU01nite_20230 [Alkalibacterium putridalgicola]|uniref:Uncharacterized protein n=1 Tax=Alkalibacterium putridalgicola TaxID=426703 RepID=A0ABQ0UZM8_9LACT|nr:hypothetical protein APU01nite_20230 [Alkalibacterium putridalgicola]
MSRLLLDYTNKSSYNYLEMRIVESNFKTDIIEIDGFRFSLIWPSLKKVDN